MRPSIFLRHLRRRALPAALIALLPLVCGGWLDWLHGPQSTFEPEGPVARSQLDLFMVTVYVTGVIFVLVAGTLAYVTLKFKARNEADEHAEPPPQSHGNPLVEISLIGLSVLALVIISVPTLKGIWYSYDVPAEEKATAYEVTATGYQWWFKFEYPAEKNSAGAPVLTANELVIPAGKAVHINLRSNDVMHSFWVPKLAGKVDMIPNRGNHLWLKADAPGYFWGQCAEFCGEDHAVMRFRVIALNEKDFADWLANQKQPARTVEAAPAAARVQLASYTFTNPGRNAPGYSEQFDADPLAAWQQQQHAPAAENTELIAEGRALFKAKTCITCHTVRGHEGIGIAAPDLTHVGARSTIAGGLLENNPQNLHRWITDLNNVKPGNKMYMGVAGMTGYMKKDAQGNMTEHNISVSDTEAHAIVAYLSSLK